MSENLSFGQEDAVICGCGYKIKKESSQVMGSKGLIGGQVHAIVDRDLKENISKLTLLN